MIVVTTFCIQPVARKLWARSAFRVLSHRGEYHAQPHPLVLRPFDRGLNMIAARSKRSGRVARPGIGHEAFLYSLQRASASRWRPPAQQRQCGADANRALGRPARRAPPIAGAIP
jgi:hypothetical protein